LAFPAAALSSTTAKRMAMAAKAVAKAELMSGCSPGSGDVGLARGRLAGAGCFAAHCAEICSLYCRSTLC